MVTRYLLRKLNREERRLGGSLDYVRYMLRTSFGAFYAFTRVMPMARYRRVLPPAPYHVARLAAVRNADCGECLRVEANLARKAGVSAAIVGAALDGRISDLPIELAGVFRFAEAVARASSEVDALRIGILSQYGDGGLVELSIAIVACGVFPTLKRALGYTVSCSKTPVTVE